MKIEFSRVNTDNLIFGENFFTRQAVQSRGGTIAGCTVGSYQGGSLMRVGTTDNIVYKGTEGLSNNAQKLTLIFRFTSSATLNVSRNYICNTNNAFSSCQWFIQTSNALLVFYVNGAVNYFYTTNNITASTDYFACAVYDGTQAAANRGVWYLNGAAPGTSIIGTLSTSILPLGLPISIFNAYDTGVSAPNTDVVLRNVRLYNTAWSAQEVLDDYNNQTYAKAFGGGP